MKNKEVRSWLIILLLQLIWIPLFVFGTEAEQDAPAEAIEEEWDLIRWKQEEMEVYLDE